MVAPLLLMLLVSGDDVAGFTLKAVRMAPSCLSGACTPARSPRSYRVSRDEGRALTAKDRAFAADGSYCSVVGAKRCTSKGRRIFSTDFTE